METQLGTYLREAVIDPKGLHKASTALFNSAGVRNELSKKQIDRLFELWNNRMLSKFAELAVPDPISFRQADFLQFALWDVINLFFQETNQLSAEAANLRKRRLIIEYFVRNVNVYETIASLKLGIQGFDSEQAELFSAYSRLEHRDWFENFRPFVLHEGSSEFWETLPTIVSAYLS
ncbi:MAG: hypothetical protein PF508_22005 [Spirochaeta sp.]|jgi:hypothetical protein|nr:hypothetical protein [Spirochaeta sp.]